MKIRSIAVIVALVLLAAVAAEASDRDSPEKVVKAYWDAQGRGDYEGAWVVVSDKSRSQISMEQFIARQEELGERKLFQIKEVVIEKVAERSDHVVVYTNLKTMTPFGPQENPGSCKVVKENGRWGLVLTKKFIAAAKQL